MDKLDEVAVAIARELGREDWESFRRVARVAVEALREPTQEMLDAAMPMAIDWGYFPEEWARTIDFLTRPPTGANCRLLKNERSQPPRM